MSNIEQFAPAQFTEGFNTHNENPLASEFIEGPGGPENPIFKPVELDPFNEPPTAQTFIENTENTQFDFDNQANNEGIDNANVTAAADAANAADAADAAAAAENAAANAEHNPPYDENGDLKLGPYSPPIIPLDKNADGSISQPEYDAHQPAANEPPQDTMGQPPSDNMGQPPSDNMGPPTESEPNMIGGDVEEYTNYAPANFQTGGDGFRLGVDAEMVGGQAVVNGYDNEQHVCGGYGEELAPQVGGGAPFNFITDPESGLSMSIFSSAGKALLKRYVKSYKHMQSGGAALLDGVDVNSPGALYDGVQNAGAENMPDACGLTYDAHGDVWTHTQVGGGKRPCGCDKGCKSCETNGCDENPDACNC